MSLINDALKKAQKQRTGDTPSLNEMPALGGQSAARIARRGKPDGSSALLIRIGAGVGVLVALVVVAVLFLRRSPETAAPVVTKPAIVAQAQVAPAPAVKPVEVVPQPVTLPPANPVTVTAAPLVVAKVEPVHPKIETPPPAIVLAPVVSAPVISVPAPEAPKPVSTKVEPRAATFIESIRVAGIRASGSDRKVLMNDRVYRIGDLVEPELGLTLVAIAPNALTFQDEKGRKYTRNF